MCNRYSLTKKQERLILQEYESLDLYFMERFNIAPTQSAPVILIEEGKLVRREMKWGFIPKWSKVPIRNAQFETLDKKPTFKEAFQTRRCLVPATGFYEWQSIGKRKQPLLFQLQDEQLFFFAGLYSNKAPEGNFVIVTEAANKFVRDVHNRMPFILGPDDHSKWLDPKGDGYKTVKPTTESLKTYWVSDRMNSSRVEGRELAKPVEATVKSIFGGYPLPNGLPEGATVRIQGFQPGYFDVEFEGKTFRVFLGGVTFKGDTGMLL
ncbi:MAG TPA: SOS response-associated peptidase [Verrucomicrobiae bacterium]|jgi:putative SOS response-associated peptidase YedK|nr:SOS response-associated peptidase [Verrucomicrobiae bacterium]